MEQKSDSNVAIVRNIQNNDLYQYFGENRFTNLRTLKTGVVDDETAGKIFKVNADATGLISKYPNIKAMIHILGLKIVNNS
jgi:aspartyl/asparaginyl-tRNA synthetase